MMTYLHLGSTDRTRAVLTDVLLCLDLEFKILMVFKMKMFKVKMFKMFKRIVGSAQDIRDGNDYNVDYFTCCRRRYSFIACS